MHATATSESPPPPPPFGDKMRTLTYEQVKRSVLAGSSPRITGSQYVASFNWLEDNVPTMIVPGNIPSHHERKSERDSDFDPGLPPKWTPHESPPQLQEDAGDYYRDINAAQYSKHPLEAAVCAVLAQTPDIATTEVDLFACGSTLGNLLRFSRRADKTFRFIVETVGETVFFVQRESSPTEKILDVRGYGHSMPDAYTSLDDCVKKSVSHQRLVKYDLGGFECIVRHEGDGYLDSHISESSPGGGHPLLPSSEGLRVMGGGKVIPQEAIFDIKTRSFLRKSHDVLAGELDRLWLRQIPNFILAYHQRGVFNNIEVMDVREHIAKWEAEHESDIRILSALMGEIIAYARERSGTSFEVCSQQLGILEFRHVRGHVNPALPADLRQTWSRAVRGDNDDTGEEDLDADADSDAKGGVGIDSGDDEAEPDYTACSAENCGYCGQCKY